MRWKRNRTNMQNIEKTYENIGNIEQHRKTCKTQKHSETYNNIENKHEKNMQQHQTSSNEHKQKQRESFDKHEQTQQKIQESMDEELKKE